jgi:peptide chain release factor 1
MLDDRLVARCEDAARRAVEIEAAMSDPATLRDQDALRTLGRELAEVREVVDLYTEVKNALDDAASARELLSDATGSDRELLENELRMAETRSSEGEIALRDALAPKDPLDAKDVILEIRAAAGGDEAALFAGDLATMYQRFAETQRLKAAPLALSEGGMGGFKELILEVRGKDAYRRFKYESGVHRVQRVPVTESQGRIHTSTATVAVLPEADEVEVEIDAKDLHIDVYRSSGPGGQSVNTTDSAVRITHLPTGEVVACQEERSQLQNKERAMRILRARLYERAVREQHAVQAAQRKGQVGTGERSEKIRTYNFKENRVTDHRIKMTRNNLTEVLAGDLGDFVEALSLAERAASLEDES